jgi:hypothetical protein
MRPLSPRAKILLTTGSTIAVSFATASTIVATSMIRTHRQIIETRKLLDEEAARIRVFVARIHYPAWVTRAHGPVEYRADQVAMHWSGGVPPPPLDAWGFPLRLMAPGPIHKHGWDLWSVGPNGIDERGDGDDLVVGEDIVSNERAR